MLTLRAIALIAVAAFAALACAPSPTSEPQLDPGAPDLSAFLDLADDVGAVSFGWTSMTMVTDEAEIELGVFIADTPERRSRGLMYATGLPPNNAMLFVFEDPPVRSGFWNNNVPIDLHVAFLDADGRIMEILTLEARSRETRQPQQPYSYALEVPAGRFDELGIGLGDRLLVTLESTQQN